VSERRGRGRGRGNDRITDACSGQAKVVVSDPNRRGVGMEVVPDEANKWIYLPFSAPDSNGYV